MCPGCNGQLKPIEGKLGFFECQGCNGLIAECVCLGDSYGAVAPRWDPKADEVMRAGDARYYDLSGVGSDGPYRRHGWYNPATKLICQTG